MFQVSFDSNKNKKIDKTGKRLAILTIIIVHTHFHQTTSSLRF